MVKHFMIGQGQTGVQTSNINCSGKKGSTFGLNMKLTFLLTLRVLDPTALPKHFSVLG